MTRQTIIDDEAAFDALQPTPTLPEIKITLVDLWAAVLELNERAAPLWVADTNDPTP